MKIADILIERKIDEAPVGMLKRAGLGIAAKFGSDTAKGALDTANIANGLRKAYSYYLGQTGQKPNSDSIIAFLKTNGLATDGAERAIQQASVGSGVKFVPGRGVKNTTGGAKPGVNPTAAQPGPGNAPAAKIEPTMDEPATAPGSTSTDDAMMNKLRTSATKAKLKGGRGIAKQTPSGFSNAVKAGRAKGLNMSHVPGGESVMEVDLKSSTVDKIILATIQDNIKQGMGQELSVAAGLTGAGAGTGGAAGDDEKTGMFGKFTQGVKQGMQGTAGRERPGTADPEAKKTGSLNMSQILQMFPEVDPNKLKQAMNLVLSGQKLNQQQLGVLGQVMGELVKMDAQNTVKVMNILKRVSA